MYRYNENFKICIAISLLLAGKYGNLIKFCKFQLGEGVNAILKKVGLYLQNDSYLTSNSPCTIKFATKLNLTFIRWSDMQINYLICIFINIDETFRK